MNLRPAKRSIAKTSGKPRLSLRARGVSILAVPLAALFVALFAVYWAEGEERAADVAVARAWESARSHADQARRILENSSGSEPSALAREIARAQQQLTRSREDGDRMLHASAARDLVRQRLFRILLFCGMIGPIAALFVHLLIAGRLVRRLSRVEDNARRLAHGLPLSLLPEGTDEIASLASQLEDASYLMRERERKLRQSESRYRDLFDRAPVAYEETDLDGVVRRFNQEVCTLLKCTPDRVLGRRAWDFVAPGQKEAFREAMLNRIASGQESGPLECDYLLDDGSQISVEIRESLVRNESGAVTGVCRSVMDVTERNLAAVAARKVAQYATELRNKNDQLARALEATRAATEAKSRFLASVSHELRTPLNGIIGFSELMQDGKLGSISDDQREIMGDILGSARHLLRLISDILDLSKVEAGKMEFNPEPAIVDRLVHEVRDTVRPIIDKKRLQLDAEVPAGLHVVIDTARFKQVLYNYLSNAVKFTTPGGRVSLRVSLTDSRLHVEVEDTGIGIPPEELPLLFNEFRQLPNSRKADQGTGLGLALTRHIIEAQGGTVSVRSILGRGSIFTADLPVSQPSDATRTSG
jgi:PAS domain S-box-containing protein